MARRVLDRNKMKTAAEIIQFVALYGTTAVAMTGLIIGGGSILTRRSGSKEIKRYEEKYSTLESELEFEEVARDFREIRGLEYGSFFVRKADRERAKTLREKLQLYIPSHIKISEDYEPEED